MKKGWVQLETGTKESFQKVYDSRKAEEQGKDLQSRVDKDLGQKESGWQNDIQGLMKEAF
ncbi:hypothetical protein JF544_08575 [Halobacillus kuroshimensis]|uniref:CsbD family protein n=1 Tax=Halobacillus kuroshimensis TaxID=302481 RepID=A0ABS3DVD2_9BACI|nr:hypothetical protein [Halobacillus kuroshimensis]MBN8235305.1 hypothetical protein [Halobacillus kuroshimensis]